MQRVIDDPTELNWKKFFLLATILFDNDSTRLLKDRKSLLLNRLVSLFNEDIQLIYSYDITRDQDVEAIDVESNIIETVSRKSRNLVAHGLDKTRYEHLKKLFGVNIPGAQNLPDIAEFRELFTQIIQRIVNADLPASVLPMFKDLESVALPKNDDDIRPVGLQVIYCKIAGTVCQRKTYQFNKAHFENLQYCTTKSGTEIISHSFRLVLEEKLELDVFAMDGDNAFNRMNRMRGLFEIRKHFPAMSPFLRMVYGSQSTSWYSGLPEVIEGI
jgi:hypothetical protein